MQRILIVEDEEAIANLIKVNLEAEGYCCTCAYDGKAGADYIEKETFDLILLDINQDERKTGGIQKKKSIRIEAVFYRHSSGSGDSSSQCPEYKNRA